jgi:vacuolar-type H+-ATPase subunit E/Vma4
VANLEINRKELRAGLIDMDLIAIPTPDDLAALEDLIHEVTSVADEGKAEDVAFAAGVEAAAHAIEADQGFESRMERAYAARIVRRVLDRRPEPTE